MIPNFNSVSKNKKQKNPQNSIFNVLRISFISFLSIEMPFTGKEKTLKQKTWNFECFQRMSFEQKLVKFLDSEMISIFLKHPVHLQWYKIL